MDGVRVSLAGETIDEIVNPADVEAVEVYTNPAEIPSELGIYDECGAIFI